MLIFPSLNQSLTVLYGSKVNNHEYNVHGMHAHRWLHVHMCTCTYIHVVYSYRYIVHVHTMYLLHMCSTCT